MTVSLYSFVMAILWFSIFIVVGTVLQRKTELILCGKLVPLLFLLALTVFRLFVPVELPFTQVVQSHNLYPAIQDFLHFPLLTTENIELTVFNFLLGVWLLGVFTLSLRLCHRLNQNRRIIAALPSLTSPFIDICLQDALAHFPNCKNVRLIISSHVTSPALVGLLRPVILLPEACSSLSAVEVKYILAHELTHLKSHDILVKTLIRFLCCFLWWNPFVYLLQYDLDSILEYKCDLSVTKGMQAADKYTYLQAILTYLKQLEARPTSTVSQMVSASFCGIPESSLLKQRFEMILHGKPPSKKFSSAWFTIPIISLFLLSYLVVFQPANKPPAQDLPDELPISPETAYIQANPEGTYELIVMGESKGLFPEDILQDYPLCELPLINK
ncbi:hypothetical protein OBV_32550 [Oscillibacter valericigenes Sjm18-20]|nr:hypothetical protein OBV_32550 [Oscillibacter valericigenes Sjm18-20]